MTEQLQDSNSIFNFYRELIALRKAEPALVYGHYDLLLEKDKQIYAYTRTLEEEQLLIICNLSAETAAYSDKECLLDGKNLLIGNYQVNEHGPISSFALRPFETRIYRCL